MRPETPVSRLPRYGIDPIVLAERQGFDDGYFGNENKYMFNAGPQSAEEKAYHSAFREGEEQRRHADFVGKKRKVKR